MSRPSNAVVAPSQIGVVALGDAVGACARYGAALLWPTGSEELPWTTWAVNVTGCAVMGIFMVLITEARWRTGCYGPSLTPASWAATPPSPPTPPTIQHLVDTGHPAIGLVYLAVTLIAELTSTGTAAALTHSVFTRRTR